MTSPNTNATPLRTVTPRVAGLMQAALDMVTQADYEGDHARRGHPAPGNQPPWNKPDAPYEVLVALREAESLLRQALDYYSGDPVTAMRDQVIAFR